MNVTETFIPHQGPGGRHLLRPRRCRPPLPVCSYVHAPPVGHFYQELGEGARPPARASTPRAGSRDSQTKQIPPLSLFALRLGERSDMMDAYPVGRGSNFIVAGREGTGHAMRNFSCT